jgi:hypothetical protein
MPIINDYNINYPFKEEFNKMGTFQIEGPIKHSKTVNFFEQLYSYPQRLTLKWDLLTDTKQNSQKEALQSFINLKTKWDPDYTIIEQADSSKKSYLPGEYLKGFLNKNNTTKFYKNETKNLQIALANIPVFVVLNGDKEIVLNTSYNLENASNIQSFIDKLIYNSCGGFGTNSEKYPSLGLFFMTSSDAENYLNSIAKSDIDGTKTVGLSVHCIGLDSAYKITREDHPGIDFRFIPTLDNVKNGVDGVPIYIVESEDFSLKEKTTLVFFEENEAQRNLQTKLPKTNTKKSLKESSLENLLEIYEEQIQERSYKQGKQDNDFLTQTYFVSTSNMEHPKPNKKRVKVIAQGFQQKTRILKRFIGIFFSVA